VYNWVSGSEHSVLYVNVVYCTALTCKTCKRSRTRFTMKTSARRKWPPAVVHAK